LILFGSTFDDSYYRIEDTAKLKKRFVSIMLPVIQKENAKIYSERTFIENTIKKSIFLINSSNISQLLQLKKKYKIARLYDLRAYLRKIDIIPPSLALAQASLESGWGKSRFAKEANNLFGQWTYTGNGMVPENREEGKIHTIRIFRDLEDSVENYMLNLNIGWAYTDFRQKRYELRQKNETLDGYLLSETLLEYSSAGQAYVDDLKTMIDTNGFRRYDYLIKQQSQKGLI
jgi:Bax protein